MKFNEKLYKQMLLKNLNQQKLAKISGVSDSEVSRILGGKSQPGLENAFRLAKAVGVSLDYLADDALDTDPAQPTGPSSTSERNVLQIAREIGFSASNHLLEVARFLTYEVAIRRLIGAEMKPVIEVGDGSRTLPGVTTAVAAAGRTNSASA